MLLILLTDRVCFLYKRSVSNLFETTIIKLRDLHGPRDSVHFCTLWDSVLVI